MRLAAFAICSAALPCSSSAIILTLAPTGSTLPADPENVNQSNVHVVGGTTSGIDYGGVQSAAVFTIESGPGGTGNFGAFLGTSDKNKDTPPDFTEQGHNTGSNKQDQSEVNYGTNTDNVQISELGIVTLDGTTSPVIDPDIDPGKYVTFAFDMNPVNSAPAPHVTYNEFQVWISPTEITAQYELGPNSDPSLNYNLGTLVWDLDANGTDNSITIHPSNNGSGTTDLLMYIPVTDFLDADAVASADYYVYVWHELETYDETTKNDHGYVAGAADAQYLTPGEELASVVPEQNTYALIAGLLAFGVTHTMRRRR